VPIFLRRIEDVVAMPEGIWLQLGIDGRAPAMLCVDEGRSCAILKFSNAAFCDAGLEVGVDAAKGNVLTLLCYVLHEDIFAEAAVVGMVMKYLDAHCAGIPFEGMLGHEGLFGSVGFLQINKAESTVMVDEDGGHVVALDGEPTLDLPNEAGDS
jgi:hypothetical protein